VEERTGGGSRESWKESREGQWRDYDGEQEVRLWQPMVRYDTTLSHIVSEPPNIGQRTRKWPTLHRIGGFFFSFFFFFFFGRDGKIRTSGMVRDAYANLPRCQVQPMSVV